MFVRLNPDQLQTQFSVNGMAPRSVDAGHARRAVETFQTYLPLSFQIDLNDLSTAIRLDRHVFPNRPWPTRLLESGARLLSPVL